MMNLEYFLFIFIPSVQNAYFFNDIYNSIKNGAIVRNLPQLFLMLTIVMILIINDSKTEIGIYTLNTCIALIPFNFLMN